MVVFVLVFEFYRVDLCVCVDLSDADLQAHGKIMLSQAMGTVMELVRRNIDLVPTSNESWGAAFFGIFKDIAEESLPKVTHTHVPTHPLS